MAQTQAVVVAPSVDEEVMAAWCEDHLGAAPVEQLFTSTHLSRVIGLRLGDGASVVVKVRAPAERLSACFAVQRHLFLGGFPCPEPILAPTSIGEYCGTAERYVSGGSALPATGRLARPFAAALARLMGLAPPPALVGTLDPPPPWTACMPTENRLWPVPDDLDVDLNDVEGPAWVDASAAAVRERLVECQSVSVIGHGDWYAANLAWDRDQLLAVHDWDSVISAPEAVIVGLAAAGFACTGTLGDEVTVDETEQFIAEYQVARGRDFSEGEAAYAWAAGLWLRVFDAKKEFAQNGETYTCNESEAAERLRRIG